MAVSAGAKLGPYEVLSAIGVGGMGTVYKARDTRLERTVAIKVLHEASPALRERFDREARVVAALQHPHICTLYDVGSHDGADFLVMEHLEVRRFSARSRSPRHSIMPFRSPKRWMRRTVRTSSIGI
jgi:eukaryotic-like serine/threonine-protein kinase